MKLKLMILLPLFGLAGVTVAQDADNGIPPLIDREIFFDDPVIAGGQLSPDGRYISFLRPYEGTRNVWVKTLESSFDEALPVTAETARPISGYFWSRDGKYILYVKDEGGDENFNIYAVDPAEAREGHIPVARNLTNLKEVRAFIYHISRVDENLMFIGLNDRDKSWHDLYSLEISTGELSLIRENTNRFTSWIFDYNDELRLATRSREDGTGELWRMDDEGETQLFEWSVLESAYPVAFRKDNEHVFFVSNVGEDVDLSRLYLMNIADGTKEFVEQDPEGKADFGGLAISDKTLDVIATSYTYDKTRRYFKDKAFENHYNSVKQKLGNKEVSFNSATRDERFWLVSAYSDTDPGAVYLYDKETGELAFQYRPRPEMPLEYLSPMISITYPSSDGLEIQAYLTLPRGFPDKNLPLVVVPHGGPWARDYWGYNPYAQFLANRGYAVLLPNFRASTGFGKSFLNAGNKEWGDLMQDDITWGVKYLIEQGIADENRIGIFGGSYGGYATLAGLAFTPDLYACGVSFVGPSNLITLLESLPPYWEAGRIMFYERMGNPNTPEGKAQLERQSPLNSADQIRSPLMVVQGQNDPRVKKAESDQIVIALRDRGFPVKYINAPDEGHGFSRPVNNMAFIAAMEKFKAQYLGGRYQETMSEEVAKRLKEITVDVTTVTLPKELSAEEMSAVPVPARKLTPGVYDFAVNVSVGGQSIDMGSTVEVTEDGSKLKIIETTRPPFGAPPVSQTMLVDAETLRPRNLSVNTPQMQISINYTDQEVDGSMSLAGNSMPVKKNLQHALFADGPGKAIILTTLPLADGYEAVYSNFDINAQVVKSYRLKVSSADYKGRPVWKIESKPADGSAGGVTVFASQSDHEIIAYEAVMVEMGGAIMKATRK